MKLALIALNKLFVDNKPINFKIAPVTSTSPTKNIAALFAGIKKAPSKMMELTSR